MTTATLQFDQPTLFKEGRITRDNPPAPSREPGARDKPPAPSREPSARAPRDNAPAPSREPAARAPRGGQTLDDVLSSAWDGLAAHRSVTCPVCHGSMAPRYGSGAQPVGGRCRRCGSTLG